MTTQKALWIIGITLATIGVGTAVSSGSSTWVWPLAILILYFLPSMIALERKVPNIGSVVVINVLLGWTFVGWVVALAMAARSIPAAQESEASTTR